MLWPDFFPKDCPPDDSHDASVIVYRIVREKVTIRSNGVVKAEGFKSQRDSQRTRQFDGIPECDLCGLSVVSDFEDALNVLKRQPKRVPGKRPSKRANYIVGGKADVGKIKHCPSEYEYSHHNWWIPTGTEPWTEFQYCEEPIT